MEPKPSTASEIVRGDLSSAHVIAAKVKGADPKVLASVIPGAVGEVCEGDHGSTTHQPSFHQAVLDFLRS